MLELNLLKADVDQLLELFVLDEDRDHLSKINLTRVNQQIVHRLGHKFIFAHWVCLEACRLDHAVAEEYGALEAREQRRAQLGYSLLLKLQCLLRELAIICGLEIDRLLKHLANEVVRV